ncbi:Oligopeptide transporter OPT superfamily [Penicillium robsamsonii]|uniref:Oligopeptide transporter OPT superfamily n=1 Tax=Penicillium robsamsonii TaxID=1792511 RepID=UPI002547C3A4|nr:Oligopeptide transporter OPT superfamily [Penicillium robsamsonii]KAJ5826479.1 Oligopeptide transporter OPT superfamily [Penicillium robsamsonii]
MEKNLCSPIHLGAKLPPPCDWNELWQLGSCQTYFWLAYSKASAGLAEASKHFNWWGTENTCDWKGCAYLSVPNGRRFGMYNPM